ncbi:MAG: lysine 2,3-aminomutase [Saprospirales bacterium]|nr:MAG: lysine 2,3-aminomutase [Saprospirales bacterium]
MRYKVYTQTNFRKMPQMAMLTEEQKFDIEVVASVLPFKSNNYVTDNLIDWGNVPDDPMFRLTFPQREMLKDEHYNEIANALRCGKNKMEIKEIANRIRMSLNPHPAGQKCNIPELDGEELKGIQHKYRETALFFPSNGQTCHAYCTFCFRWPQFVGINEWKFAMKETNLLVSYLRNNPQITDVLFTGGDPMIMKASALEVYINGLLEANLPNLKTIRIGSKALGFWPYKFLTDKDADETLRLFEKVVKSGVNLSFMAHFSHPVELSTPAVQEAIVKIRNTGAQIRTQSPLLRHINDDADTWAEMWRAQLDNNCIPYYMFVERDTGAQEYFSVPLVDAWKIFQNAYQQVSGICRTVRGPSMSSTPGKVHILGVQDIPLNGKSEKVFVLQFIQGRNPDWVCKPFFAKYDENATWLNDLKPAFGQKEFFYERELNEILDTEPELVRAE